MSSFLPMCSTRQTREREATCSEWRHCPPVTWMGFSFSWSSQLCGKPSTHPSFCPSIHVSIHPSKKQLSSICQGPGPLMHTGDSTVSETQSSFPEVRTFWGQKMTDLIRSGLEVHTCIDFITLQWLLGTLHIELGACVILELMLSCMFFAFPSGTTWIPLSSFHFPWVMITTSPLSKSCLFCVVSVWIGSTGQ